jgi:hypothetical protein
MANKDLKNLPPEERIKKLKELEVQRKKESEEAEDLIRESQDEISHKKKWTDKVPIPEITQDDEMGLSDSAKEILETLRGKKRTEAKEAPVERKEKEIDLEETLLKEAPRVQFTGAQYELPTVPLSAPNIQYIQELSQRRTAEELQSRAAYIAQRVDDQGYITAEQQQEAFNLYQASGAKQDAGVEGRYGTFTEDVEARTSLTKQVTGRLLDRAYEAAKSGGHTLHDYHRGV